MTDFSQHLIAFTGKIGSGKDTAAERFQTLTTLPTVRVSFAKKLKESAAAVFGIASSDWEWMKNDSDVIVSLQRMDETGEIEVVYSALTARELLQRYGTEAHRDTFGFDFWVDQGFADYDKFIGSTQVWLCTDCRFENEAVAVAKRGGKIVRVRGLNEETGGHVSEAGISDAWIDYIIDNSVRGDEFAYLDEQLRYLADQLDIPVTPWA